MSKKERPDPDPKTSSAEAQAYRFSRDAEQWHARAKAYRDAYSDCLGRDWPFVKAIIQAYDAHAHLCDSIANNFRALSGDLSQELLLAECERLSAQNMHLRSAIGQSESEYRGEYERAEGLAKENFRLKEQLEKVSARAEARDLLKGGAL